jgi:hypothetical protein
MILHPRKPYRAQTLNERNRFLAQCRLSAKNFLHYLLYMHGLGDLYRSMIEDGKPFAVLSASKDWPDLADRPKHERWERNQTRAGALRTELKDLGLGYLPAWGVWTPEKNEPRDSLLLFAPGLIADTAIELGRKYEQGHVIVGTGGGDYWVVEVGSGDRAGPFPASAKLRRLVLEPLLQLEEERVALNNAARRLVVAPGRRGFFFIRALLFANAEPWGVSVHDVVPGPKIQADCDDDFLNMDILDAYLPLRPAL